MAFDPKHLPDDPQALKGMVADLMAQLDRESSERSKIESLLRELLDAKGNRKSEHLSPDQLALLASLWQARRAEREEALPEAPDIPKHADSHPAGGGPFGCQERVAGGSHWRGISGASA